MSGRGKEYLPREIVQTAGGRIHLRTRGTGMNAEHKQRSEESGVVRDCVVACLVGVGIFVVVVIGIYLAGYQLAGLPF